MDVCTFVGCWKMLLVRGLSPGDQGATKTSSSGQDGVRGRPQGIATYVLSESTPVSGAGANSGEFYPEASARANLKPHCTYPLLCWSLRFSAFTDANQSIPSSEWAQDTSRFVSAAPSGVFPTLQRRQAEQNVPKC